MKYFISLLIILFFIISCSENPVSSTNCDGFKNSGEVYVVGTYITEHDPIIVFNNIIADSSDVCSMTTFSISCAGTLYNRIISSRRTEELIIAQIGDTLKLKTHFSISYSKWPVEGGRRVTPQFWNKRCYIDTFLYIPIVKDIQIEFTNTITSDPEVLYILINSKQWAVIRPNKVQIQES